MNRLIIILLCIFGVVVCAFLAFLGKKQEAELKKAPPTPPSIACKDLLTSVPNKLLGLQLTEFKPGRHFVPEDHNGDQQWDRVLIPVFPSDKKALGRNYKAVIVVLADTPDKAILDEKVNGGILDAEYWRSGQTLDNAAYNRLAEKYTSMDFSRSVVIYSGYPKTIQSYGNYLFWGGAAGCLFSILVLSWQSLSLVTTVIKKAIESEDDDAEETVFNRAGLPTRDENKFSVD